MHRHASVTSPGFRRLVENDQLQVSLEDAELMSEVQLTVDLIIAASDTTGHLQTDAIDRLLGL